MPEPTPFHERTERLCQTYKWKEWAGYHAVCTYGLSAEREYNAIRQGSGLLDATPLFKYDLRGSEAGVFLNRIMVKRVSTMKPGRMTYLCWCDEKGKVLDDGTVACLAEDHFRVTSAAPAMWWFAMHADPYDVVIEELTTSMAALALQGPTSRKLLTQVTDADMEKLKFFRIVETKIAGRDGYISRTGYTGDLGYELWMKNADALDVWDALVDEGKNYGLEPIGLDALDITRVEAGFILRGVDYTPANEAWVDSQTASPFEIGLGWTVKFGDDQAFIGQRALEREKREGSAYGFVGIEIDWPSVEELYGEYGLPPHIGHAAWRCDIPLYKDGVQVGRASSGTWSPTLKKYIAIGQVEPRYQGLGTWLDFEMTVEWERRTVPAKVVKTPFFDPPRKRS